MNHSTYQPHIHYSCRQWRRYKRWKVPSLVGEGRFRLVSSLADECESLAYRTNNFLSTFHLRYRFTKKILSEKQVP